MLAIDIPAPVLGFMAVHAALRAEAGAIETLVDRGEQRAAARRARLLGQVLGHHHRAEDELLWPALRARAPHLGEVLAGLERDHHQLDPLLAALPHDLEAAGAVATRLHQHLAAEEQHALPVWLATFSPDEHARFGAALQRHTPFRHAGLMISWLLDHTPAEGREVAAAHIPRPLQMAHGLWWERRYRRRWGRACGHLGPAALAAA